MPATSIRSQKSIPTNSALTSSRYRPEIDGLRAFAVVAVIINHFNKDILPGGYLGVDIFFVISGYVITSSLFGRSSKDFKDFISGFYERRIKRLVPALSVFILITSIAICLFNPSPGLTLRTGITSLFGLSNLYLLKQSTDYFAQSTELNVFTHTWSLGVEEQFYILFPFLIWFTGFGRQTKNGAHNLFLAVGALTIASLIGFLYLYSTNQPAAYFLMPSRFWEMASGCLIFIGFQKRASIEQLLEKVPPLLVMALIVAVMYLPVSMAATSTVAVVAFSSILVASLKKQTAAFKALTNPKIVYVGLISYSLYLWHWGVLSISRWTIGIHWWSVPFQVALMVALAVASYRYIETPLRKGHWIRERWKTLGVGGGILFAISCSLIALSTSLKNVFYIGKTHAEETIGGKSSWIFRDSYYYYPKSSKNHFFNCHLSTNYSSAKFPESDCTLINNKSSQTVFFAGNSHSEQYRTIQKSLQDSYDVNIYSISVSTCTFPGDFGPKECETQKRLNSRILDRAKRGDVVVIINRYPLYDWGANKLWTQEHEGEKNMEISLRNFNEKGVKVVIFAPAPEFLIHKAEYCRQQPFRLIQPAICNTPKSELISKRENTYSILNSLKSKGALVFDPMKFLCQENTCPIADPNSERIMYPDGSHIATFAVEKYLKKPFMDFIAQHSLVELKNSKPTKSP